MLIQSIAYFLFVGQGENFVKRKTLFIVFFLFYTNLVNPSNSLHEILNILIVYHL